MSGLLVILLANRISIADGSDRHQKPSMKSEAICQKEESNITIWAQASWVQVVCS